MKEENMPSEENNVASELPTIGQHWTLVGEVIRTRRTIKPMQMNGQKIPQEQVKMLLELADWAPNHGRTEPWKFFIYEGAALAAFCADHADLYKKNTPADKFVEATWKNLQTMGDKASHLVIACMIRGNLPKIPHWEEQAACAAAIQNVLLGATALGIASYWGTGGMVQHPVLKNYLNLREEDQIMGAIYLGYSDLKAPAVRMIPLDEKLEWISSTNDEMKTN